MGDMADYFIDRMIEEQDVEYDECLKGIKILHETSKAYLILHQNRKAWFPKSICQVEEDSLFYPYSFIPQWDSARSNPTAIKGDF